MIAIRRLYDADFGYGEIAEAMNVSRQTVSNVVNLRTHKRVKDIPFTPLSLPGSGPALVCDLVDEVDHVLYEAKGDVRRTSVRMAIGQLLDYRRFEPSGMSLAILLPREPARDLIELILSVPASAMFKV